MAPSSIGQALFTIDAREYRAQVATAEANLASAEANLASAPPGRRALRAPARRERHQPAGVRQRRCRGQAGGGPGRGQSRGDHRGTTRCRIRRSARADDRVASAPRRSSKARSSAPARPCSPRSRDDDPAWVYFSLSESELLDYMRRYGTAEPAAGQPAARRTPDAERRLRAIRIRAASISPTARSIRPPARIPCAPSSRTRSILLVPGLFARIRVTAEKRNERNRSCRIAPYSSSSAATSSLRLARMTRPKRGP